ncbi:hypothetical protein OC845_004800 [Tilletia horrida]|nr:hypothetical protein OC845_004800 [Tilletia horrida]
MFERRDPSKLPTPGTHAPDFITPLAWASLIIPVIFLVLAGIWIAVRFGRSNLNPADMDLNTQEGDDEYDDDDEDEDGEKESSALGSTDHNEKRSTRSSFKSAAAGADAQLQPLLERDEDEEQQEDDAKPASSRQLRKAANTDTPSSQWKLRPGYSSTEKKSRS